MVGIFWGLVFIFSFFVLRLFREYSYGEKRSYAFSDGKIGEGVFLYSSLFAKMFLRGNFKAVTVGKLIFVKHGYLSDESVIHELRHTVQYEELGFFRFLWEYFKENRRAGYACNVFEEDARDHAGQNLRC